MHDDKFLQELKRVHLGTWNAFFSIYNFRKSLSKSITFRISIFLCLIIQIIVFNSSGNVIDILERTIARNLSIIPNLLGFAIGGYALLLSGYSESILKRIVKTNFKKDESKLPYNSFQKTSSVFGMAIFAMAFSLMLNYLFQVILESELFYNIDVVNCFALMVNTLVTFALNLVSIYSLLLIFNIVINLFSFSQYISGIMTVTKKEEDLKDAFKNKN